MDKKELLQDVIWEPLQRCVVHVQHFPDMTIQIGNHRLHLLTSDGKKKCIEIGFHENYITLYDYYLKATQDDYVDDCPFVDHDAFFIFLDFLSSVLQHPIGLNDASFKTMNRCENLDGLVYMMEKKRTFYERYGFRNDKGLYHWLKDMPFEDAVKKNPILQEIYVYNDALNEDEERKEWSKELLKAIGRIASRTASLRDVSRWFFHLCEDDHDITSSKMANHSFTKVRTEFERALYLLVRSVPDARDYEKPVSTRNYMFSIDTSAKLLHLYVRYPYKTGTSLCNPI